MTKRTSIFLSLSGETIYLSDRVLRHIKTASADMFAVSLQDSRTLTSEAIRNVLLAGLEGVDSDCWNALPPDTRETYLFWLLGCLDGLLSRLRVQEQARQPESANATVH